jgi:hypothetical protein
MTAKPPATRTVHIVRKSPVAWLNLQLLVDTGILAAVSSFTGSRSPRREVLAALELASPKAPEAKDYFDYSHDPDDEVWIDFIADLGDGFNATHSIAWLVGRDYVGLGPVGQTFPQPVPNSQFQECGAEAFVGAAHVLKAGQITIFGGDLVYPYPTQTAYEDRAIGPYHAARPWQLEPGANPETGKGSGRRLFSIPGNHDWYDGLAAFVKRFCQPHRWMGCWEVQQRRSYFAIKLPHDVWIWGVDLATADDFDAPQLEYFTARGLDLKAGDEVILCVPKPAWVDRVVEEGTGANPEKPTRSWESWNKVEEIKKRIYEVDGQPTGATLRVILSGDLHHYSRYETPDPEPERAQLITCGGGGAFLLGTDALPRDVTLGTGLTAALKTRFPTQEHSKAMRTGVLRLRSWRKHWKLHVVLGITMLCLVWLLEAQGRETFVMAPALGSAICAFASALFTSPVPLVATLLVFFGFYTFARSDTERQKWRAGVAGLIHGLAQLLVAILLARFVFVPGWTVDQPLLLKLPLLLLAAIGVLFTIPGIVLSLYLLVSCLVFGLHRQEVFSAQAIEDCKAFLRIRLDRDGITIFPIGLNTICRDWTLINRQANAPAGPRTMLSRVKRLAQAALNSAFDPEDEIEVPSRATHLTLPKTPLAPHLIEGPIRITRRGPLA